MNHEESKTVGEVGISDGIPPSSTENLTNEVNIGGSSMEEPSSSGKSYEDLLQENEALRRELDDLDEEIAAAQQNHDVILDENALISLELQQFQRMAQQRKSKLEQDLYKILTENHGLLQTVNKLKGGLNELSQLMFEAIIQLNSNAIVVTPTLPALSHYPIASSSQVQVTNKVQENEKRCERDSDENSNLRLCLESGPAQNQQDFLKETLAISSVSEQQQPPSLPPQEEEIGKALLHSVDTKREDEGFYCICGASLSSRQGLKTHIQYFTYKYHFACTACPKRFFAMSMLRAHMKSSHRLRPTERGNGCRKCGRMFPTRTQLYRHHKTDHNSGAPPELESSTSRNRYAGNLHAFKIPHGLDTTKSAMHPGDTSVHCVCGRGFKMLQHLHMHVKHYSKEPQHRCQFCNKLYYKALQLKVHMEHRHQHTHLAGTGTTSRSQQCEPCGIVFQTRMAFNQHVKKQHNQKPDAAMETTEPPLGLPLVCLEPPSGPKRQRKAPVKYQDQDYLPNHPRSHICPVSSCQRTFHRKDHLKRHLMHVHKSAAPVEEKPDERHGVSVLNVKHEDFQCLCGQQFTRKSSLRDHIRLKRGLISFPCPVCKQSLNRHDYLKKHMQKFHNLNTEGTMACTLCGMGGFQNRNEVEKHKMTYHKNATDQDLLLQEW